MSMPADSLSFRCRRRLGTALFFLMLTVLLMVFLGRWACTNKDILVIGRMVRLSVGATTVVAWLAAGAGVFMVWYQGRIVFNRVVHGVPDVIVSDESISFPVENPDSILVLPFREIEHLSLGKVFAEKFLVLQTASAEHRFSLDWLKNEEDEQPLITALGDRWSATRRVTV